MKTRLLSDESLRPYIAYVNDHVATAPAAGKMMVTSCVLPAATEKLEWGQRWQSTHVGVEKHNFALSFEIDI
jgi:hypothetical protein